MHARSKSFLRVSRWIVRLFLVFLLSPCREALAQAAVAAEVPVAAPAAAPWPAADQLFRSDPLWLGGDGAFSVDLGGGRVLWMLGDSFIATSPGQTRRQATFVRNSVAIETGYDPAHASVKFYAGQKLGKPSSFIPSRGKNWFWPMHGIRLGNRLLLFCMREAPNPDRDSLGFQSVGWNAFLVDNPDAEPAQWKLHKLTGPESHGTLLVGMAVLPDGEFLNAFVLDDTSHDAYLLRWPLQKAAAGKLSSPQWWCGAAKGWQMNSTCRQIVIPDAGSEFSVQRDPRGGFLQVAGKGFGASTIVSRHAMQLVGPWSNPQTLYRPPESDGPNPFVYGAKAHPELRGAALIVTYTANGSDERLATDMSIYFPRFVRVTFPSEATSITQNTPSGP